MTAPDLVKRCDQWRHKHKCRGPSVGLQQRNFQVQHQLKPNSSALNLSLIDFIKQKWQMTPIEQNDVKSKKRPGCQAPQDQTEIVKAAKDI